MKGGKANPCPARCVDRDGDDPLLAHDPWAGGSGHLVFEVHEIGQPVQWQHDAWAEWDVAKLRALAHDDAASTDGTAEDRYGEDQAYEEDSASIAGKRKPTGAVVGSGTSGARACMRARLAAAWPGCH